jgi:integrase
MAAAKVSTSLVSVQPAFTGAERLALAGYLAGYRGLTREAYTLGSRQFTGWCRARSLPLFSVRRADIETFARELEARGRARATATRRLSMIAGFYRYAVEEELLDHSPAAHVRRPRVDYESHATALDRNEVGALLVAAGLGPAAEHALISLLALNGLRVPEATGADIEHLGLERGHRTLVITRKGGKVVTIPLAPRTARAIDLIDDALAELAQRCGSWPGDDLTAITVPASLIDQAERFLPDLVTSAASTGTPGTRSPAPWLPAPNKPACDSGQTPRSPTRDGPTTCSRKLPRRA